MEATRQLYWNIDGKAIMYVFALLAFLIFSVGFTKKVRRWRQGRPVRYDNLGWRFQQFFSAVFKHDEDVFRGTFRRFMHLGVFYGFAVLTFGTIVIGIQDHFGIPLFYGKKYLVLSLFLDLFGLFTLIGIGMAAYKRYIDKPDHEEYTLDDALLLMLLFLILFTGFILEGLRIYATNDPWAGWSPVGLLFAGVTQLIGLSIPKGLAIHAILWYFHMLLTFGLIAYIPYSKLFHMVSSPLNNFLRSYSPTGTLTPIQFPGTVYAELGAARLKDFSRKQLVELDACISCGRCQKGCPAHVSGAPLSPKAVVQRLKKHSVHSYSQPVIDQTISPEMLWSCTTCGLCEVKCPMYIDHVKRIVDLRRSLATQDKGFPSEVLKTFKKIAESGNPWGQTFEAGFAPTVKSQIPLLSDVKQADVLYWVGCFGAYQTRNQKVTLAMFNILERAGINFAILGEEEHCCGDSVRRLGNEKLFQDLAVKNVDALNQYNVKTILTHCPHCYNTLKNDYPQFGGHYQVIHHTEFISELLNSKTITLKESKQTKVAFHDPCYLGRYNRIYNPPREVLSSVPGLELVELIKSNKEMGFCCGAGGGRIWMNENVTQDKTINKLLVKKAMRTEAEVLASACSLCLATLTEAVSNSGAKLDCKDIAELVSEAL